jgi:leader peptidase (prepilin peptidase)/N-methyltransferase
MLRWFELIPVASHAALAGRCRTCGSSIGSRQLVIEGAAGLIGGAALAVAPGLDGIAAAVLGWMLLALAVLDHEHFWLPDKLTLPLAALGLAASPLGGPPLVDRMIGLAAGYGSLALVAAAYQKSRGRTGLGAGDWKLLGALGAWLGWRPLPAVVLVAALLGLTVVAVRLLGGAPVDRYGQMAFGTLLAVSGWTVWLAAAFGYSWP